MGGYPGPKHRMPVCCEAMYGEKRDGDEIISAPAKGKGAKLTIRYKLPRRSHP
jgi:5-methylcytosine-specific restriction protein A